MVFFKNKFICYIFTFFFIFQNVLAKRSLKATSLVACMENSQLTSNSFNVTFNPDDRSLHYDLDLTTDIDSYIYADVDVYAYGFKIITKYVNLCEINWKQFCPVHPGRIEIESIEYISKDLVDEIPNIAYQVPDIDAYARVKVYSLNTTDYLACIQVFFSNGKTVSQTGVKWATAIIAGIGLLLSASLSTFGNSIAASHISANTMSLFLYFQSVVVVAMEHVHRVPPIAASWAENLAWSMGLIKINFMQKIFRWYIDATGGTPSLYMTSTTVSVLTQRSLDFTINLMKRATNVLYGNRNTIIFRGIERLGYAMGIENTSIVATGFTFFVLCGYVLAGFIIVVKYSTELCVRLGWLSRTKFQEFRLNWRIILKGALLRYVYIGFTQLTILSCWEFTERDSAAVIVIACLFLILSIGLMIWSGFRTIFFANKSIQQYDNPAALLYGNEFVLHKYGFFYTMFTATYYWWNIVLLSYVFLKSLFIGFAQASGQTQALAIFILDLAYFIAIVHYKPYLDKPTNVINILICTVNLVNAFLFLFFSDLFGQPYTVSAVMGWIFFILNAAFSFILLMMILAFTGMIIFSKNPDLRFKPAKDDRTSFQRRNVISERTDVFKDKFDQDVKPRNNTEDAALQELAALGQVARDHDDHWQENFDKGNEIITSSSDTLEKSMMFSPFVTQQASFDMESSSHANEESPFIVTEKSQNPTSVSNVRNSPIEREESNPFQNETNDMLSNLNYHNGVADNDANNNNSRKENNTTFHDGTYVDITDNTSYHNSNLSNPFNSHNENA